MSELRHEPTASDDELLTLVVVVVDRAVGFAGFEDRSDLDHLARHLGLGIDDEVARSVPDSAVASDWLVVVP